jgi:hypothetical protein
VNGDTHMAVAGDKLRPSSSDVRESEMRRLLVRELPRAVVRLLLAIGLFGLVDRLPWPPAALHWVAIGSFGLLATAIVVICGTLVYDTLYPAQHQYPGAFWARRRT